MKRFLQQAQASRSFKNLVIYGIGQVFNLATPLLAIPHIVRICGESGYGKISIGMALAFFLIVFVDYGSDIMGVKDVAVSRHDPTKLERIFLTTFAVKFLFLAFIFSIATLIFLMVPYFRAEKQLFFLSLTIVIGQFINPTWFLQGIESFKWITGVNIASKVFYLGGVYLMIDHPNDYIYNNLIWGGGMIIANGIAFIAVMYRHRFSFARLDRGAVLSLIRTNFSIFTSQIFVSLQMYAPVMLIGFFGGNHMAGQFKIVDQVIVIYKTYLLLFFNYAFPRVCYLLETNAAAAMRFWKTYNGFNLAFIVASMTVIWAMANPIVAYFNPRDVGAIVVLLRLAVVIPVLQAVAVPLRQLLLGWNKQVHYVRLTMFSTMASLIMVIIVTPLFKITGVILTLALTEILVILLYCAAIKNELFARPR